jgi:D-threo-aldose 1-dehydrogenase
MPNPAQQAPLGRTGLNVSQLSLGTAPLGNLLAEIPEDQAEAAFAAALDAGLNYIDTAPFYGYGLAEERVGRALQGRNRDDYVISTKVGRLIREGERSGAEVFDGGKSFYLAKPGMYTKRDYSYDGVMTSLEESLNRLGMDRVDILHIHDPDDFFDAAVAGAYKALAKLREEGVIKGVSAGMNQWEMLSDFMDHGAFDAFLLAGRYTLLDQTGLPELLPKCVAQGTAIIAGGVYNSGLLADPRPGITFNYVPVTEEVLAQALKIKAICEGHGVPMKAAAIQFPLAHPAVPTVLTGVRSAEEFAENLNLFETDIPADLWAELRTEGLLSADAPTPS